MTTELATVTMDAAQLGAYGKMVDQDDKSPDAIPVLKINYDAESCFERGKWIVGQAKDKEGNITAEGELIKGLVILTVKRRYSFYVQTDLSKCCQSSLYSMKVNEVVRGNKYGYQCGAGCPNRNPDAMPRCKNQVIVYGIAFTEGGKAVACQAYIQGVSFFPIANYFKALTRPMINGKQYDMPPFWALTLLGTEKKKNGGSTFWEATFKQGPQMTVAHAEGFEIKRQEVIKHIEAINSMHGVRAGAAIATTMPSGTTTVMPGKAEYTFPVEPEPDDVAPFDMDTVDTSFDFGKGAKKEAVSDDSFDIEETLNALLGKRPTAAISATA